MKPFNLNSIRLNKETEGEVQLSGIGVRVTDTARSYQTVPPSQFNPKVIAAIPCFNTQNSIAGVIARAKKYVDEVIVIDDGSSDMTAAEAAFAGAKVINHGLNKGYGEAIKSCFLAAKNSSADVLVIIDGDGQHDPDDMPRLLTPIIEEGMDLVIGSRFLHSAATMPGYRRVGIDIINWLWNLGSRVKVSDTQSGYRAYSKDIINGAVFHEKGMGISIEILEKARRSKARLKEVPIFCSYANNNDMFSLKALIHGFKVSFSVLKIRFKAYAQYYLERHLH